MKGPAPDVARCVNTRQWLRRVWVALVAGVNLAVAAYVGYVVFLFTEWPVDRVLAEALTAAGWWGVGARRFVYGTGAALLATGVLFVANRLLLAPALGSGAGRWARRLALGAGVLVLLSALTASLLIALRRPVM